MGKTVVQKSTTKETKDKNGNTAITDFTETIRYIYNSEPEYIKLYIKKIINDNRIPKRLFPLFIELAIRMTYCDASNMEASQTVNAGGLTKQAICERWEWKPNTYQKMLRELCDCGAIYKTKAQGWYQINPEYASRGFWIYKPKSDCGGIDEFTRFYKMREAGKNIKTEIKFADTGDSRTDSDVREGLGLRGTEQAVLMETIINEKDGTPF